MPVERNYAQAVIANRRVIYRASPMPRGDGNMGNPVQAIIAGLQVLTTLLPFLGTSNKKPYNDANKSAQSLVASYGTDVYAASMAAGLDPAQVAQALSEYLRDDYKITLSPAQIFAMHPAQAQALGIDRLLPLIILAALIGGYFIMRR